MIRFLQTPGPIRKFVLAGILVFISAMMAISLSGVGSFNLGVGTPDKGVVATVSGEQVTTNAVQREAKQMLNLLCGTPPVPAGRLVAASDGWQPRDGYDVAVLIHGSGLP